MLVDGHLRAETTPDAIVPVLVLDVDEAEADKILLTLDPLAGDGDDVATTSCNRCSPKSKPKAPRSAMLMDEIASEYRDAAEASPAPRPTGRKSSCPRVIKSSSSAATRRINKPFTSGCAPRDTDAEC